MSLLRFRDVVAERAICLEPLGFTERQSRFLATVMAHSGVFLERQYCRFAGIAHGQKSHDFIERLVQHGFARVEHPAASVPAGDTYQVAARADGARASSATNAENEPKTTFMGAGATLTMPPRAYHSRRARF